MLVEDNPGDARLILEVIKEIQTKITLNIVTNGILAMEYLRKIGPYKEAVTPDIILLDLNIPKMDGRKVLYEIKNDPNFKKIPVIVLTISQAENDIINCYDLHANCYISKPFEVDKFIQVFKSIVHFWFYVVALPVKKDAES